MQDNNEAYFSVEDQIDENSAKEDEAIYRIKIKRNRKCLAYRNVKGVVHRIRSDEPLITKMVVRRKKTKSLVGELKKILQH
jgi:hypothetical protein